MGNILTIDVDTADVQDFFTQFAERITSPQDFLAYVGQDMVRKFQDNIEKESGGPDFPGWAPLRPFTVKERERLGYGGAHPMLQRTEDLYSHLAFNTVGPESVSAGTDGTLDYPAQQDLGEGNIPQRAFVWVDDERVDGWIEVLGRFLVDDEPPPTGAE